MSVTIDKKPNGRLQAAVKYAERGWRAFPVGPNSKVPLIKGWPKKATTDLNQIQAWWQGSPKANVGITCGKGSNLVVLDVDVKNGAPGLKSLAELESEHGKIDTLTAKTPSGGFHFYFQHPGSHLSGGNKVLPGLDIKADGGCITAPPSSIDGVPYSWTNEVQLASCPPWLVQLVSKAAAEKKLLLSQEPGKMVHEGERNNTLMRLAGALRRHGATEEVILKALLAYNEKQCGPPLPASEVQSIAKSMSKYAPVKVAVSQGMTAAELMESDIPEPVWVVPELLPAGITLVAGKPKIGKSWLALDLAVALTTGGKVLGKVPVESASALCLCLEDNRSRLKQRLKLLLGSVAPPQNLHLFVQWPKFANDGIQDIETWLATHPEAKLVVVDTLARVRKAPKANGNQYHEDYEAISALRHLADTHGVAVLLVHHTRKAKSEDPYEMISGTTGMTGAADTIMVLQKGRGTADAVLHVVGRDVPELEWALSFDKTNGSWHSLGDAALCVSKDRQKILEALKTSSMGPKEISAETGISVDSVKKLLPQLVKDGLIKHPKHGLYEIGNKA